MCLFILHVLHQLRDSTIMLQQLIKTMKYFNEKEGVPHPNPKEYLFVFERLKEGLSRKDADVSQ